VTSETPRAGGYRPLTNASSTNTKLSDDRAWRKHVDSLPDDELIAVVRGIASVDRAVDGYRRRR
jgi:hypothetical protein